jgi:hypothetical protein
LKFQDDKGGGNLDRVVNLYSGMIDQLIANGITEKLVTHYPMKGTQYNGRLMVIGRAVNGWEDSEWIPEELIDPSNRNQYLTNLLLPSTTEGTCPLEWVKKSWGNNEGGYNSKKSAFWRVVYRVMCGLDSEEDWSSRIVWSNLYKIAPAKGGNPSARLINLQMEKSIQLIKEEIILWKPENILFLTGLNWSSPFIKEIPEFKIKNTDQELVEGKGYIEIDKHRSKVIIAKHPQGKNEIKMVEEIIANLNKCKL